MFTKVHTKFILTPLLDVLTDGVNACHSLGDSMSTWPISEYFYQSLFLKMTGAQEQKMKCICWEMATNNYRYRYSFLNSSYGECSTYQDKNKVYKDIISLIREKDKSFKPVSIIDSIALARGKDQEYKDYKIALKIKVQNEGRTKKGYALLSESEKAGIASDINSHELNIKEKFVAYIWNLVNDCIKDSILEKWSERDFIYSQIHKFDVLNDSSLPFSHKEMFSKDMQLYYKQMVYDHRNRCAHNLTSYQQDIPSLDVLANQQSSLDNYFLRYAILILIDDIFRRLYNKYLRIHGVEGN